MIGLPPSMRRVLAAVAAAIVVTGLGCRSGSSPPTAGPGGREPTAVIVISDAPTEFMPNALTIKAGETVEWRNTGEIAHSVEFVSEPLPEGLPSSPLGLMAPHKSYSYTFKTPGTYAYICRFHVINGMVGKIIVVADKGQRATDK